MRRPIGVTVIACAFLAAGIYFCSISAIALFTHGPMDRLRVMPFVRTLRFISPYLTLLVGILWALIAWGLFQLRDWARFTATLMLGIGIAWAVPMMFMTHIHFGWRMLAGFLEIALRAAAIGYFLSPSVLDIFMASRSEKELFKPSQSEH